MKKIKYKGDILVLINKLEDRQMPHPENVISYKEYRKLIKNLLRKKAPYLLKNEDVIADLIAEVAIADCRWSPDKGTKQSTWRILNAGFYINKFRKQMKTISLNAKNSYDLELGDIISANIQEPIDELITNEAPSSLNSILDKADLTKKQRKYIEMHYLHDIPVKKIAEDHKVSEQSVYLVIDKTLAKLKSCLKN